MKTLFFSTLLLLQILVNAQSIPSPELLNPRLNVFLNVRDFTISDTKDEAYFTIQSPDQQISQMVMLKKNKDQWETPTLLSFCDSFNYMEPFLSPNGNRLYFASDRPLIAGESRKDFDIWYVDRPSQHIPWSEPKNLGTPINTKYDEFYPTLSLNQNLYFTKDVPNGLGKDDIYFAKWDGNQYLTPELLNTNINSEGYEFNAFISRNEDFILYSKYKAKDGLGSGDLYISKKVDGIWQTAKNLGGNVNSKYMDYCPYYDEHSKTLYFTSKRNTLKRKNFQSVSEFQDYIMNTPNGLSKIYHTKIVFDE